MSERFAHIWAGLRSEPWAIMPGKLELIVGILQRRCDGIHLSPGELDAIRGQRAPNGVVMLVPMAPDGEGSLGLADPAAARDGSRINADGSAPPASQIAVLNVMGVISQRISAIDDISGPGGTSTERVSQSFASAISDPAVKAVVVNIDSPGGSVFGVQELADQIMAARGQKPITAQVSGMAASAAYWIASACDEIVVQPSGMAGSIGVYTLHQNVSGAMEKAGVQNTFIYAGPYKVEGNSLGPLTDEAAAAAQQIVDSYYDNFTAAVAKGRGATQSAVKAGYGQGRVLPSSDAKSAGLVDRIGTLSDTLKRLGAAKPSSAARALAVPGSSPPNSAVNDDGISSTDDSVKETVADDLEFGLSIEQSAAFRRRRHAQRLRSM